MWYWISLPYATFGVRFREGRVIDVAPIFKRKLMGRDFQYLRAWVAKCGGGMRKLDV